jgi:serine-type D-Ala-D-Ala carboxypeptidase/endopeptidase (penicillin-binding protein 4)
MHPDYKQQPVMEFLKNQKKIFYCTNSFTDEALGYGWAWDDYMSSYMTERNSFPIFGNTIKLKINGYKEINKSFSTPNFIVQPSYFKSLLETDFKLSVKTTTKKEFNDTSLLAQKLKSFSITRKRENNELFYNETDRIFTDTEIPMSVQKDQTTLEILKKDFDILIKAGSLNDPTSYAGIPEHLQWHRIKTQPTDSVLKPMMHRSDNFFAEQSLLMVSNEKLGYMNDADIIDYIKKNDFNGIPQMPRWVDGSGLSRYNMFTPQSLVWILNKMKNEFGMERIKNVFATGGEGTLSSLYKTEAGFIFAKTGTLSNHVALSGFLYTKKGKLLIFSILTNGYQGSANPVRKAVEKFLIKIRTEY